MPRFDWIQFLEEHRIPYVTSGPNTAHGHVSIKCPFCGNDPSQHMGLKLTPAQPYWGCWRNAAHRGRHPRRLVQKLLGCNFTRAQEIVERQQRALIDAFDTIATALQQPAASEPRASAAALWPKEFRSLPGTGEYAQQFVCYLAEERGFGPDAEAVAKRFQLHYCLAGDYAWRLILPFYDAAGQLLGWTGRAIRPDAALRYRTARGLGKALYGENWAAEPEAMLLITEGPLDALKLEFYGVRCHAVATLGTTVTVEQLTRLIKLIKLYPAAVVLFDLDAELPAAQLVETLATFCSSAIYSGLAVLAEVGSARDSKDPGALTASEVLALCEGLRQRCFRGKL